VLISCIRAHVISCFDIPGPCNPSGECVPLMHVPCLQVRYNAVRRQTAAKAGEKELQVLDYQNTNAELMPLVAAAYALIFMVWLFTAVAIHAFVM